MNTISTKYAVGDRVWLAWTETVQKQHPCPDCNDTKKWKAISPAGTEYEFACPRCSTTYQSNRDLSLHYREFAPSVRPLTIGSVRVDTNEAEDPVSYMCLETGVGSGSVYDEKDLFHTEAEAHVAAEAKAKGQNASVPWVAGQYSASLALSDYQMDNATLASARNAASKTRVNVSFLFDDLRMCETMEEVQARIERGFKDE